MRDLNNLNREHDKQIWENDKVQFARLINELDLLGVFDSNTIISLGCEMDLPLSNVYDLIERAKNVYDKTVEQL